MHSTESQTARPAQAANDRAYAFGSQVYAWFVVLILSALEIASYLDRQIINLVVQQLRRDFNVSDVQVSYLQGFAFTLFYGLVAVPIGWAVDRWTRKWIIIAGAIVWSAGTLLCMAARDYQTLFVARMIVGLGEASLVPTAFSMLSDYFPRAKVAGAISAITASSFLGSGIALALGGMVLAHVPRSDVTLPLVGRVHGWQLAFGIVSLPGLILVVLMAGVREPPRRSETDTVRGHASTAEIVRFLGREPVFWGSLVAGIALLNAYQYGLSSWGATFFIRSFHWSAQRIGILYGLYFVVLGSLASFTGGFLCNQLVQKRGVSATLLIPLGSAMLALPLVEVFALSGNADVSAATLGVLTFVSVLPFGPGIAAIPLIAPNRMRGQLLAIYMLVMTLIGSGGGPWLIAWVTEQIFHDPQDLKYSIALVDAVLLSVALTLFWIGYVRIRSRLSLNIVEAGAARHTQSVRPETA